MGGRGSSLSKGTNERIKLRVSQVVDAKNITVCDVNTFNITQDVVEHVKKAFPDLSPKDIFTTNIEDIYQADISGDVLGYYEPASGQLVLSNSLPNQWDGGDFNAVCSKEGVIAHEIGHGLSIHTPEGYRSVSETFDRAYKEYAKEHPGALKKDFMTSVSGYAATCKEEMFAESFSVYFAGGYKPVPEAARLMMENWKKK